MCHIWTNGLHFEKWGTFGKWVKLEKNGSHLEKCVALEKMGHTLKKGHTLKNGSHLEKCVTF